MTQAERTVRTLIGHKQVEVGLKCLASLVRFSAEPLSLILHDDGTLTPEDHEKLTSGLQGASVLTRAEADSVVIPLLAKYSKCRAYRERHPLALKLIDMALIETGELAYCDSDILFLKPYRNLFSWPNGKGAAVFMQDSQEAYSLYPWHAYPIGKVRIPRKVNTGLILFRCSEYDLDFVEWILGQPQLERVFQKRPHWIEQTCWAALGARVGCYVWSERQLVIASSRMEHVTEDTVAIHFVAAYRGQLAHFPKRAFSAASCGKATTIEAAPASNSSSFRLLKRDVRRKLSS
jgi:hypothetical protein